MTEDEVTDSYKEWMYVQNMVKMVTDKAGERR